MTKAWMGLRTLHWHSSRTESIHED